MMRVRVTQVAQLQSAVEYRQFEEDMVIHLREFVPKHSEVIGEEWVRCSIRFGIQRAGGYGVINPGLLRFYVELMFMFGGMFDTDPLFPWVGNVLCDTTIVDEATRMDRLYDATHEYLNAIGRLGRPVALPMLCRLKQIRIEEFSLTNPCFENMLVDALRLIEPERCAYVGDLLLRQLVRSAPDVAARHDLAPDPGIFLVACILFVCGHGFAEDPTFPWIQSVLHHPAIKDPSTRAMRLRRRIEAYIHKAFKHFERQSDVCL